MVAAQAVSLGHDEYLPLHRQNTRDYTQKRWYTWVRVKGLGI